MTLLKSTFLFTYFLLLPYVLFSQEQHLVETRVFTPDDGLANLMTNAVIKDRQGFLWIATQYGLNRYNGYTFELYSKEKNNLVENDNIHRIDEDEAGNLWLFYAKNVNGNIPDDTGFYRIDIFNPITKKSISLDSFFTGELPFKQEEVLLSKIIDPKNRLWITTTKGELFLLQSGVFKKIYEDKDAFFQYVSIDEADNIWLGYQNNLTQIDSTGKVVETIPLNKPICGLWTGEQNQIWLATAKHRSLKTHELQPTLWSKARNGDLLPFDLTKNNTPLEIASQSGIFIHRTEKGYWYVRTKEQSPKILEQGIKIPEQIYLFDAKGNFIKQLKSDATNFTNYFEEEEQVWVTTSLGLLQTTISPNPFKLIHKDGKTSDCRGITEDELGNIYFLNRGLYQWKPNKKELVAIEGMKGYFAVSYFDSLIWAGDYSRTKCGIQINLRTNEINRYIKPDSEALLTYALLKTDSPYQFLAGQNKGISYLNLQKKQFIPFTQYNGFDTLRSSEVYHFHQNKEGIWLATNNGIFLLNEQEGIIRHYDKASGDLPFNHIRHIYKEEAGTFWLATRGGGIIKWTPSLREGKLSKSQQFTTEEGLSNNYTYAIYGDDFGKLWISSDKGLMCMDSANYKVRTYLKEDGLVHNEFNLTSYYQAKDGTLYFGGLGGLISFHPKVFSDLRKNDTPLTFTKCSLLEEDQEEPTDITLAMQQSKRVALKPTDKFLEVGFSLMDYDDPSQHNYSYEIEGYSINKKYIKKNYININSLPYGSHTLKIRGRNNSSGWSTKELSLVIDVLKPFYAQTWFILLSIVGSLLSIFAGVKLRLYKLQKAKEELEAEVKNRTLTIQQQSEALKVLDKAKARFFSNITHELRTPLTLVIGPLEQMKEEEHSRAHQKKLKTVLKNAQHLSCLINQLLDISKLEAGGMQVETTYGDIIEYTNELVDRIKSLAYRKKLQVNFVATTHLWETQFDKEKWDKIIYNLLSNAIKFTPEGGHIDVLLDESSLSGNTCIHLQVADTGIGINKTELAQIFNRFYQVEDATNRIQAGTGIGLALVKELVELQGGLITVSSKLGEGTTFDIKLPLIETRNASLLSDSLINEMPQAALPMEIEPIISKPIYLLDAEKQDKLKVLIIEDNEELRDFIRQCLHANKYQISEAADGVEGIEKAQKLIPDLIISDVMMPEKNGFEVTKSIRTNIATSHIPIILLTAKAALDSRLEGIRLGADVYLTKPFSPSELKLRVEKLIEVRLQLQKRINNQSSVLQTETAGLSPKKEHQFVENIRTIIEKKMESLELNGEFIGKQIGMSRMQLHRKMKALSNQSIGAFIRECRLQKAYELLTTSEYTTSEIAYQTGFNTPSYFSTTFKKRFGFPPSELKLKISN